MDLILPPPPPGFDPSCPNKPIKPSIDVCSIKHMLVIKDPSGTGRIKVFDNEKDFKKAQYEVLFSHPGDAGSPTLIDQFTFE